MHITPLPSARLTFRSWADDDTSLAEALWCDPQVTYFFGGAMTPQQAHTRLHVERECENRIGMQYWPIFYARQASSLGAPASGNGRWTQRQSK